MEKLLAGALVLTLSLCEASISGFYADNGITQQTMILKRLKTKDQKEMQHEILTLFGLQHRPKPPLHGKTRSAPKFMLDLYETLNDVDSGSDNQVTEDIRQEDAFLNKNITHKEIQAIDGSDMIMSFVHHAGKRHVRHDKHRQFFFEFSEVSPSEQMTSAELKLYKDNTARVRPGRYIIHIYALEKTDGNRDRLIHDTTETVQSDYRGWLLINVTAAASIWQKSPQNNFGLYMIVNNEKGKEINPEHLGIVTNKGTNDKQPFLVAFFKASDKKIRPKKRKRRSVVTKDDVTYNDAPANKWSRAQPGKRRDKFKAHRTCQKRTLYVSFRDLGWQDWIIAPDGYAAFYCQGECSFPLNSHMNATNHAIVQTLVHLMKPKGVPQPCCAPTKLTAISVLYFDDNSNVILKKYRNMVVKSCGCH